MWWPFRRRPKLHVGDRVTWRFSKLDSLEESSDGSGLDTLLDREGVVEATASGGKLLKIAYANKLGESKTIWRDSHRVTPLDRSPSPQRPAVVDARVLEVVTALQKAVGGTDALIDLLQSVGAAYGIGKEDAS